MSITLTTMASARIRARYALPLMAAFFASGCAETGSGIDTGQLQLGQNAPTLSPETVQGESLPPPQMVAADAAPMSEETAAAIRDARSLRQNGNKARALGILEKAPNSDEDKVLLLERGLLSLEMGQIDKAAELLKKAHNVDAPNWQQHSGLGAALSAQGKQGEAQDEFNKALALSPNNAAVLNNLALSYALDGKHAEAERLLRNVSAREQSLPQSKQNLALILGLRGNIEEARKVSEEVLPPEKVKSNVAYLEKLNAAPEQVSRSGEEDLQELVRAARATAAAENEKPVSEMGLTHAN